MIEGRLATTALACALACASVSVARAEQESHGWVPRAALELRGGYAAPVGVAGAGLALRFRERLDLTIAAGVDPTRQAGAALAVSARGWLLRGPRLAFGIEAGGSRHPHWQLHQDYDRPGFGREDAINWYWRDYYRADGALTLRVLVAPRWSLQLAAGASWILSRPSECEYEGVAGNGWGQCFDARTPQYLHFNPRPVRPYGEVALAYDMSAPEAEAGDEAPSDPRVDRAGLAPTARAHAPGTLILSDEELFIVGAGYVLPDGTELVARLVVPVAGAAGLLTVKRPLLEAGRFRLAALGAAGVLAAPDVGAWGGGAGLVAGVCLDWACESLASAWALGGYISGSEDGRTSGETRALFGPNLLLAVAPQVKLVAELDVASAALREPLALVAVRIFGRSIAFDAGVLFAENEMLPIGSLTWRPSRKR